MQSAYGKLKEVFEARVISRLLYAVQSWIGYFSRVDIENVQKLLFKAKRWRLVNADCYLTGMLVHL